jgi:hypothetical protein
MVLYAIHKRRNGVAFIGSDILGGIGNRACVLCQAVPAQTSIGEDAMKKIITAVLLLAGGIFAFPHNASACSSCFGAASGPQIEGMNMAIMSMLGIVGLVLSAVASFFIMMRKRLKVLNDHSLSQSYLTENGDIHGVNE